LPDKTLAFSPNTIINRTWGYQCILADMPRYIDADGINVTLDLKLNKENQLPIIL